MNCQNNGPDIGKALLMQALFGPSVAGMALSEPEVIELYSGEPFSVVFREDFCEELKTVRLDLRVVGGHLILVVVFLDEENQDEPELKLSCRATILEALRLVNVARNLPLLSKRLINALAAVLDDGNEKAKEYLSTLDFDATNLPAVRDLDTEVITAALRNCRENGVDFDASSITEFIRKGELSLSEDLLAELNIEAPEQADVRLEREQALSKRITKSLRKYLRFVRRDEDEVESLLELAIEMAGTGQIETDPELIGVTPVLSALDVDSLEQLEEIPGARMAQILERNTVALNQVKSFISVRFRNRPGLYAAVTNILRWWDVRSGAESPVEDSELTAV